MGQLVIRQAGMDDASALAELDKLCFSVPWSASSFEGEFKYPDETFYIVAETESQIVGYMGEHIIFDEGHITNVAVHPDYRRKHIASSMMRVFIAESEARGINAITLEVRAGNYPAIGLYEGFGFKDEGRRKNYYPDNHEDAIIMWRYKENEER